MVVNKKQQYFLSFWHSSYFKLCITELILPQRGTVKDLWLGNRLSLKTKSGFSITFSARLQLIGFLCQIPPKCKCCGTNFNKQVKHFELSFFYIHKYMYNVSLDGLTKQEKSSLHPVNMPGTQSFMKLLQTRSFFILIYLWTPKSKRNIDQPAILV